MNIEQLITQYENHKHLTNGFLQQQNKQDHKRIAQKIHQWTTTQGHTTTQQEIEQHLDNTTIGTKQNN